MKLPHAAALILLSAVTTFAAGVFAQESVARRYTETSLGPLPEEAYDSAVISPDGRRIAYVRQIGDQQAAHRYQAIWNVPQSGLLFDGPRKFHYLALKGGSVYLVEEEISERHVEGNVPGAFGG